ncbi:MAG: hypothetical protein PHS79_03270 [Patescibacteria group bacterium]|nr:hypothetical protein [Patescibacteria group bacterium]
MNNVYLMIALAILILAAVYFVIRRIARSIDSDGFGGTSEEPDETPGKSSEVTPRLPDLAISLPPFEEPKPVDVRDMEPIEQMKLAGYRCTEIADDDEFRRSAGGNGNFESDADVRLCVNCGTDEFPFMAWGTSKTKEDGFIGCFCSICGCGFLAIYSLKNGNCDAVPETVPHFLRPDSISIYDRVKSTVDKADGDNADAKGKDNSSPSLDLS